MAAADKALQEPQELKSEIESLRARLLRMSEAGRRITESLDLETVLQEVIDCARSLTGARYGALTVFDESGRVQDLIISGIALEERRKIGPMPKGAGLIGYLNEVQEPLRLADLSKHPRSVGIPDFLPPMKTFLGSPISDSGKPAGNIYLTEKEGGEEFTRDDEETIVMFASMAATAIANASRYEDERRARSEAENELERLETLVRTSPVGVLAVGREPMAGDQARILYLDDDPQSLQHIRSTLSNAGYAATVTESPHEMLRLLQTELPDLVLLDLILPETDGFALMERIRGFSDVPVIFLSASSREEHIVKALEEGADDYIVKPFSPTELVARIESVLRKQRVPEVSGER